MRRAVLPSFLISRAVVFALMLIGGVALVSVGDDNIRSLQVRRGVSLYATLSELALSGDATGYREIAMEGYTRPQNRAYFPGFPLAWRAVATFTHEYPVTGLLLSNVCFLGALPVLYLFCLRIGLTPGAAERAVFYACFWPASHFFSLPLSESLFLLLSVVSVYLATCEKWVLAGLFGIATTATRLVGLMLIPTLLLMWWQRYRRLSPAALLTTVPFLGLAGFCVYLSAAYGDAIGFLHTQSLYGHSLRWGTALLDYIRSPRIFHAWHFYPVHVASIVIAAMAVLALVRHSQIPLAVYLGGCVAIPLCSDLASMTRYAMGSFPLFIGVAYLTDNPTVDTQARAVCVSLLAVMALACGFHLGLAMT